MLSVAQVVEEIVKHKPYLPEALAAGIIFRAGHGTDACREERMNIRKRGDF